MNKNKRQYSIVQKEHGIWAAKQGGCIASLYLFCVTCDPFGDSYKPLEHDLSINSFKKAKKILEGKGLFKFRELMGKLPSGKTGVIGYQVLNLYGTRVKQVVEGIEDQILIADDQNLIADDQNLIADDQNLIADDQNLIVNSQKTLENQAFQEPSLSNTVIKAINNKKINNTNRLENNNFNLNKTNKDARAYMSKENENIKQDDGSVDIDEKIRRLNEQAHILCNTKHRFSGG